MSWRALILKALAPDIILASDRPGAQFPGPTRQSRRPSQLGVLPELGARRNRMP